MTTYHLTKKRKQKNIRTGIIAILLAPICVITGFYVSEISFTWFFAVVMGFAFGFAGIIGLLGRDHKIKIDEVGYKFSGSLFPNVNKQIDWRDITAATVWAPKKEPILQLITTKGVINILGFDDFEEMVRLVKEHLEGYGKHFEDKRAAAPSENTE